MRSKTAYLIGGIFSTIALLALFIISIVFCVLNVYAGFLSVLEIIFVFFALCMTICCFVLSLTSKNEKTSYMIVVPTVMINLFFTSVTIYTSAGQYLLVLLARVMIIVGAIFYILGVCSSLQQHGEAAGQEQQPKEQQPEELNLELKKLLAMKEEGLITPEEFDKLKMNLISKMFK